MLEATVAVGAHLVQDAAVQVQRRQRGKPAVVVQLDHVALHGAVQLLRAVRHRLPSVAERLVHRVRAQALRRVRRRLQHLRGQVDAPVLQVLAHVAQDVGQLHGHAQRHRAVAQTVVHRRSGVQDGQQHEPHRPGHVVAVFLQVAHRFRLTERQVATLSFQHVEEGLRVQVERRAYRVERAPQRSVDHGACEEPRKVVLHLLELRRAGVAVDAVVGQAAERVQRVHALALASGQQRERSVEAMRVAPDHVLAPREIVRALFKEATGGHRASAPLPPASR